MNLFTDYLYQCLVSNFIMQGAVPTAPSRTPRLLIRRSGWGTSFAGAALLNKPLFLDICIVFQTEIFEVKVSHIIVAGSKRHPCLSRRSVTSMSPPCCLFLTHISSGNLKVKSQPVKVESRSLLILVQKKFSYYHLPIDYYRVCVLGWSGRYNLPGETFRN